MEPLSALLHPPKVLGPFHSPHKWYWNGIPVEIMLVASFVLAIGLLRVFMQWILYMPLARWAKIERNTDAPRKGNLSKFLESCYKWTYYPIMWAWGLHIVLTNGWHQDTTQLLSFYCYYLMQMSFYIYSLIAITTGIDVRRKDFWLLVTHHVVTVALMAYSWNWGFFRVGILVLVCLDPGDVFLEIAKSFNYCHLNGLGIATFVVLIIAWIIFRLYYLLMLPIRSAVFEARALVDSQGVQHSWYEEPAFVLMLAVIYLMQVYWFYLILRVAERAIKDPSNVADVREEENWNKKKKKKQN